MRALLVAAACLAAPVALADGISFKDGLPQGQALTWLALTPAQEQRIAAAVAKEGPDAFVDLELTVDQQRTLRQATGVDGTWLRASTARGLGSDCTCGAHNLGLLQPGRVGVLHAFFRPVLSFERAEQIARTIHDPTLAAGRRKDARYAKDYTRDDAGSLGDAQTWLAEMERPDTLGPLAAFRERVPLTAGWRPARIRLATRGTIGPQELLADDVLTLLPWSEADVRALDTAEREARWAVAGAVRRSGETTTYAVPVVADQESEGYARAWLVLRYRGGLLQRLVLHAESSPAPSVLSLQWTAADGGPVLAAAAWGLP